jgi:hypothetical protein
MKRLRGWLVSVVAGITLGLCIVFVAALISSLFFRIGFQIVQRRSFTTTSPSVEFVCSADRDSLVLALSQYKNEPYGRPTGVAWAGRNGRYELIFFHTKANSRFYLWDWNLAHVKLNLLGGCDLFYMVLPIWALLPPCMVFPIFALIQKHRRRRRLFGVECLICGYDLRATPGRCPECGTIPPERNAFQGAPIPIQRNP